MVQEVPKKKAKPPPPKGPKTWKTKKVPTIEQHRRRASMAAMEKRVDESDGPSAKASALCCPQGMVGGRAWWLARGTGRWRDRSGPRAAQRLSCELVYSTQLPSWQQFQCARQRLHSG